jgi:hypothetical protein
MEFFTEETGHKTAEEYRAIAEAHRQAYKNQWKTFFKCGIFVMTTLVALIALAAAWFVNNSRVAVDGVNLSSGDTSFELGSYGRNGIYDDIISEFFENVTVSDSSPYTTSGARTNISWLVSDDSNIGNFNEEDVDFSTEDRKDYAIEPGSDGELTFYIVPGKNGTQTFSFDLSITPYAATVDDSTKEITNVTEVGGTGAGSTDRYANQFIAGHILFFLEKSSDTSDVTSDIDYTWIKDNTFEITITSAEAGQEYAYTIYWKWPQVFSELILNEGDRYLNGRSPVLTSDLRDEILTDMVKNPQKYFYNSLTGAPLSKTYSLISGDEGIADIHKKSPVIGGSSGYNAQNFVDLSSFYNQADQIIGSRISFVLVELSGTAGN